MHRETEFRCSQRAYYRIDVQGTLDARWLGDYTDLRVEHIDAASDGAVTRLTGELVDQSALLGLLSLLNDFGVPLLALDCMP